MKVLAMGSTHGLGGLQTHFRLLVGFLAREGHEVGVIQVGEARYYGTRQVIFTRTLLHDAATPWRKLKKGYDAWKARSELVSFAPDLFIGTATGRAYAAMAAALPAATFKFYQEVCYDIPKGDKLWLTIVQRFNAIAAQTPSIERACRERLPYRKPVKVLPCFAEPIVCDQAAALPFPEEKLRLCFFGRLAANKGLAPFLESFARVAKELNASFDIHGSGPERGELEAVVNRLDLADRVKICGRYPEGRAYAALLSSYHCLVLPSVGCEGLPLVLIEAMSCGVPFLATNVGAIPDAAVGCDDVVLMAPHTGGMEEGLRKIARRLREGSISNARLREHYATKFSPAVFEDEWRRMLADPRTFFV